MKKKLVLILGLVIVLCVAMLGGCAPAEEGADSTASTLYMVGFLVLMFAAFYFFIIRPQSKRQKEQREFNQNLQPGDKVITIGGIFGRIESVREDSIIIKVESGTTMKMLKTAIAGKQPENN